MKMLVTGAAGFIGATVARRLLEAGHAVVGLDDLNDYYDVRLKEWRLARLQRFDGFTFQRGDVADMAALEPLYRAHRFAVTFNLAARAGVRASVENPWVYTDTNVTGTLNLLECCRRHDCPTFVLASTSSLYGTTETPFRLENRTDEPHSPYAATKKGAEVMAYTYHFLYGLNVSVCRYFTVFGPAGRPDMSYFKFLLKIDRGEPIPVYGDGSQSRDFTYVDDVAEATIRSARLSGHHILNVGNDRPVELRRMIAVLEERMGARAEIEYLPRHPADNPITWADVTRTRELLDWEAQISLEAGLDRVVTWFEGNRDWLRTIKLD